MRFVTCSNPFGARAYFATTSSAKEQRFNMPFGLLYTAAGLAIGTAGYGLMVNPINE